MQTYVLVIIKVLFLCCTINALKSTEFDCSQCSNFKSKEYRPQDCAEYCSPEMSSSNKYEMSDKDDVQYLKKELKNVSVMTTVLLVLVILMMILLLYFIMKNFKLSNVILKSWKSCWNKKTENVKESLHKDKELNQVKVHKESNDVLSIIKPEKSKVIFLNEKRSRKPSESLTPDDSDAVEVDGYDNLGMSRSTINTQSRCSSRSSPTSNAGATSCATIDTTMTTINLDS